MTRKKIDKSIKKPAQSSPPAHKEPKIENVLEETLRVRNDFDNLLDAAKLAALFLDCELCIRRYTPNAQKLFNITMTDRGRPIARLKRRLGYDQIAEDASQVLQSLTPIEREVRTKNGNWFIIRMHSYRTDDDEINGVTVTFTDITEVKQAEEMLRNMVDVAPDAIVVISADGNIVLVNKQLENVFGHARQDMIGKTIRILIPERFHEIHPQHRMRYFRVPQMRPMGTGLKLYGQRSDGTEFPVEISLSPLKTPDGMLAIAAIRDVTERVEAERRMRQLTTRLSEAEQREQQRISQVLHDELQQRLFAVKTHLSMLKDADTQQDPNVLQTTVAEMDEWLRESISITRNLSIDLAPNIPPGEGLADALTMLFAQMQKQYSLNVTLKTDGVKANFDDSLNLLLFQAVRELLFNVVKHAETLQAAVTFEQVDDQISVTVSDEGKGFDPVAVMNASGIAHGLLNIREHLDLMGCQMEMISSSGTGTRVIIHCPNSS